MIFCRSLLRSSSRSISTYRSTSSVTSVVSVSRGDSRKERLLKWGFISVLSISAVVSWHLADITHEMKEEEEQLWDNFYKLIPKSRFSEILSISEEEEYGEKELIVTEGSKVESVYIMTQGNVELCMNDWTSHGGSQSKLINIGIGARGNIIPEWYTSYDKSDLDTIKEEYWEFSLKCKEPVRVLRIDKIKLQKILDKIPIAAYQIQTLQMIATRNNDRNKYAFAQLSIDQLKSENEEMRNLVSSFFLNCNCCLF